MPIDSSFTSEQRDSIKIKSFIFHVIEVDKKPANKLVSVVEIDEVTLLPAQEKFFTDHFKHTAEGTQFLFTTYGGNLKDKGLDLIQNPSKFLQISKDAAREFTGHHKAQMSDGVFVFSLVEYDFAPGQPKHALFLLKINKQSSFPYSYDTDPTTGKMIATVDASHTSLVQDRKAISKSAIIDLSGEFSWDVLAVDTKDGPGITDYFRDFMEVTPKDKGAILTDKANRTVRRWANTAEKTESFSDGENYNTVCGRSFEYLNSNSTFKTDDFIKYVVKDSNPAKEKALRNTLGEKLKKEGVYGQSFSIVPEAIRSGDKAVKYITDEGVEISYTGDQSKSRIEIDRQEHQTVMTITTRKLKTNVK
ncbi:nucleoid-associated protein [Maribrevibacterium harenarium]|uniref:Nucleoid-associated protein n=1 Tax=Maribrevibacterium harenarium TaxID=2589817 RepID=A0A501WBH5_9GAMM|nr:nucleoid-associated protein [Maribrevibacterium harenarium]TPE44167.1 nucleoid-associated protein [Maribrevibacterium harenarium]